ncbi:hypothetical protein J2W35_003255 [Variovorax boronicumulans]|uniref:hypothetical protein n=1 Tax=Variovorax boronicumulans TaxID=436515 RepID=UPI00277D3242|nr:hypothetical protein [Variovorax boronicumulans]MDQ0082896.1 hypothetical protein [Variovorax boronicumulans]
MSAQHTQPRPSVPGAAQGLKPFGVFVGGAGVVWHRSEEDAKAQAAQLESIGFDVIVALHPAIAKATRSES